MKFSDREYASAIENLFSRHQSVATAGFNPDSYKPGLDAMQRLDEALGRPSSAFRSIHIAGTNGKGSVCSMLASALAGAGLRVGLYTSPHLLDFRERIKIVDGNGYSMISREAVMDFLAEAPLEGLSFFEVTTGMAFRYFAEQHIDIAVIETGLGGRLDSTNIITPELSIITSIGLDHCAILGDTREQIAAEKAGIFKSGIPALVWGHDDATDGVFGSIAEQKGCPLHYAVPLSGSAKWTDDINLPTVLSALEILGVKADREAVEDHGRRTGFRGRMEQIRPGVFCDIGHNPDALKLNFSRMMSRGTPLTIVYGVMADKDYRTNISLMPKVARLLLCQPDTPRALEAGHLETAVQQMRPDLPVTAFYGKGSVAAAVREAVNGNDGGTVFITGSTFVVSEAIKHFEEC